MEHVATYQKSSLNVWAVWFGPRGFLSLSPSFPPEKRGRWYLPQVSPWVIEGTRQDVSCKTPHRHETTMSFLCKMKMFGETGRVRGRFNSIPYSLILDGVRCLASVRRPSTSPLQTHCVPFDQLASFGIYTGAAATAFPQKWDRVKSTGRAFSFTLSPLPSNNNI